jgi:ankyrin repeat protein
MQLASMGIGGCAFLLLEHGANVNDQSEETKETPLHASLCSTDRILYDRVVEVLLSKGADPNLPAANGVETGGFMRDARTKGETALHRAAAFGEEGTVKMLLDAGARRETRDANADTPLSWASWYLRPSSILHQLCFGEHRVNPGRKSMRANLIGFPRRTT